MFYLSREFLHHHCHFLPVYYYITISFFGMIQKCNCKYICIDYWNISLIVILDRKINIHLNVLIKYYFFLTFLPFLFIYVLASGQLQVNNLSLGLRQYVVFIIMHLIFFLTQYKWVYINKNIQLSLYFRKGSVARAFGGPWYYILKKPELKLQ